jgi:hypothetical protein
VTLTASVGTLTRDDAAGTWSWEYTPLNDRGAPTTVTITATNDFGLSSTLTFDLTVQNVPPTITEFSVPAMATEGSTVTLSAAATDPGSDTLGFQWFIIGPDNSLTQYSGASVSAVFPDNGTYVVTVLVGDGDLGIGGDQAQVVVTNVAPTASITGVPASGHSPVGTAISLGSSVTDPSSVDTATGFTYAWSVTKNGAAYASGSAADFSFTPDGDGAYVVSLTATDKDGAASPLVQTAILVGNVTPTASITGAPASGHSPEGTAINLASTVTDPNPLNTSFTYSWSVTKDGVAFTSGSSADLSFTPDDNGTYVVSFSATDQAGGVDTDTATIIVDNVAPTLSVSGPTDGVLGQARVFTLTASDPSPVDQTAGFTFTIDWGEGSPQTLSGSSGTTVSHVYVKFTPSR